MNAQFRLSQGATVGPRLSRPVTFRLSPKNSFDCQRDNLCTARTVGASGHPIVKAKVTREFDFHIVRQSIGDEPDNPAESRKAPSMSSKARGQMRPALHAVPFAREAKRPNDPADARQLIGHERLRPSKRGVQAGRVGYENP